MPELPAIVQAAVTDLVRYVRERFRDRLASLRLFGSFARGRGDPMESDVDVLVVVEDLSAAEMREIVGEAARISSNHNVLLAPLPISAQNYRKMERQELLLTREIAKDGIAL